MLISEDYREQNRKLHETDPSYGTNSDKIAGLVKKIASDEGIFRVLDYGCGKQVLKKSLEGKMDVICYDPAFEELSKPPVPQLFVVCSDVLEHIEPDCLDEVLDDLKRVTLHMGFFMIATRPARKTLPDGRNAHLIIEPLSWWVKKLEERFLVKYINNIKNKVFTIVVYALSKD